MRNFINTILLIFSVLSLFSCHSQQEITYLQGANDGFTQTEAYAYEVRIRPDDLVSIVVSSKDPELALMFNLPVYSQQVGGRLANSTNLLGYYVDKDGVIDFPQLGKIHVGGMTRSELTDYIKDELVNGGLIKDPVVTVQFLNYKVSVLGEVVKPGTFNISSDRFTIFDALGSAGDLTIYGRRDNVRIIREENGVKKVYQIDLRSSDIINSPLYYLQQNDIVYVEPNKARAGQREINANRSVGTYASLTSVLLSIISLSLSL